MTTLPNFIFACSLMAIGFASDVLAADYVLRKGAPAACHAFLHRQAEVQILKPSIEKDHPSWSAHKARCPALFQRDESQGSAGAEFNDYALYRTDIDNDGDKEDVLYRRWDVDKYVTSGERGRETRQWGRIEISEEFLVVNLQSCSAEKVFGRYAKSNLIHLDGRIYIQHVNSASRGEPKAIFEKKKGQPLLGYQDELCLFVKDNQPKAGKK